MRSITAVVVIALLVGTVSSAPMFGNMNADGEHPGEHHGGPISIEAKLKYIKAGHYLFAPQPWIETFNAIPQEGQQCFLSMFGGCAGQVAANISISDFEQTKAAVAQNCSAYATQINAYLDAVKVTFDSLPASFISAVKQYSSGSRAVAEEFRQAANGSQSAQPSFGAMDQSAWKSKIGNNSKVAAEFLQQVTALSNADRQQIVTAFPKLQPFLVGENATTLLNEVTQLLQTLGAGQFDVSAIRTEGKQLKSTLKDVWVQYSNANAADIAQASNALGKNVTGLILGGAGRGDGGGGGGFGGFGGHNGGSSESAGSSSPFEQNSPFGHGASPFGQNSPFGHGSSDGNANMFGNGAPQFGNGISGAPRFGNGISDGQPPVDQNVATMSTVAPTMQ